MSQLRNVVLRSDCIVRIDLGWRQVEVTIGGTLPANRDCLIDMQTVINFTYENISSIDSSTNETSSQKTDTPKLSIGLPGLNDIYKSLFEIVAYPIVYGKLLNAVGIDSPRGVLLHGPPGVGKTYIANHVASKCGVPMVCINGPEIYGSDQGESETRLKRAFEEVRSISKLSGGCILFIDEIDTLAPPRANAKQHESHVVGQLVILMDEILSEMIPIVIIAATNRPNHIDPALRRPGREISIEPPNEDQRKSILLNLTKSIPCSKSIDFAQLAIMTNGYVGADLASLYREAATLAIKRADLDDASQTKLEINDFKMALKRTTPSLHRHPLSISSKKGTLSWDQIGGLKSVKLKLRQMIEWPILHKETFKRLGLASPRGVLLYGPPGCSKTTMVRIIAGTSGATFFSLNGAVLFSPFVGESERTIRTTFQRARLAPPSIIFFDEIDAMVSKRSIGGSDGGGGVSVAERILSTLLNEMDGVENAKGVLVVGATNRIDMIDAALLRPGRFDRTLYVPPPDEESRLEILKIHTTGMDLAGDIDLAYIAGKTNLFTGADLQGLCREAAMGALRESLSNTIVEVRHFLSALLSATPTMSNSHQLNSYQEK